MDAIQTRNAFPLSCPPLPSPVSGVGTQGINQPPAQPQFFSSKAEYLAFRAAWKALTSTRHSDGTRVRLPAWLYAGYALLRGKDPIKGFTRNNRGHGQAPWGAAVAALSRLGAPSCSTGNRRYLAALNEAYFDAEDKTNKERHSLVPILGAFDRLVAHPRVAAAHQRARALC